MCKSQKFISFPLVLACSALTVWSAWDRGGAYYSTQMMVAWCLLVAGLLAVVLLAQPSEGTVGQHEKIFLSNIQPPLLVVLAMCIWGAAMLQTLPLPGGIAAVDAPDSSEVDESWLPGAVIREALASDDVDVTAVAESVAEMRVSVATTYTRLALLGPLAFAAMCWTCFLCFRCLQSIFVFLFIIAGSGAIFSFFGLIDTIRLVRDWQVELRQMLAISPVGAGDPFGPFVNNNNASGFLCLAIGCAVGLFLLSEQLFCVKSRNDAGGRKVASSGLIISRVVSVALIVTLVAGVIGSNSRGGFLGLFAGSIVLLAFLSPRFSKLKSAFVLGSVVLLAWLLISGLGFGTRSQERFETLLDKRIMEDPRLDHWSDALVAASHYWPFGSGLGTYRYACLPFQENGAALWFVNADGMPIEWLVEGGGWLLPMVAFGLIALIFHLCRIGSKLKSVENGELEDSSAVFQSIAYAKSIWAVGLFSLPALLVTQCFDFGITLMPLLLTFAGMSGAILRVSATVAGMKIKTAGLVEDDREDELHGHSGAGLYAGIFESRGIRFCRQVSGPVSLAVVTIALGMSAKELHVASVAQDEMSWLRRQRKQRLLVDVSGLSDRLTRLERLASENPGNSLIWKAAGEFRVAEQQRLGAQRMLELQPATVDSHASWLAMKTVRHATYGSGGPDSFSACLLPTQNADEFGKARNDFIKALLLNPLDPDVRISLLELDMVAPDANVASRELLLQAARLRPRSDAFLQYLLWFAADYPGADRLPEINTMREALRQEHLQE